MAQRHAQRMRAHILLVAALLLCAGFWIGGRAQAAETCVRPTPQTLINWYNKTHAHAPLNYSFEGSAIYHPISMLRTDKPPIYWIGLAWLFPQSGALFAVNCAGTILDGIPSGAIGHVNPGPRLPEVGASVTVIYVDKETSSCVHDGIKITALKDDKIVTLWDHGYNQGINLAATDGKPRRFTKETYTLEFSNDQRTLSINGLRATYPYLKGGSQAPIASASETLPSETYHWNAKTLSYMPVKPYPQSEPCALGNAPSAK